MTVEIVKRMKQHCESNATKLPIHRLSISRNRCCYFTLQNEMLAILACCTATSKQSKCKKAGTVYNIACCENKMHVNTLRTTHIAVWCFALFIQYHWCSILYDTCPVRKETLLKILLILCNCTNRQTVENAELRINLKLQPYFYSKNVNNCE